MSKGLKGRMQMSAEFGLIEAQLKVYPLDLPGHGAAVKGKSGITGSPGRPFEEFLKPQKARGQ